LVCQNGIRVASAAVAPLPPRSPLSDLKRPGLKAAPNGRQPKGRVEGKRRSKGLPVHLATLQRNRSAIRQFLCDRWTIVWNVAAGDVLGTSPRTWAHKLGQLPWDGDLSPGADVWTWPKGRVSYRVAPMQSHRGLGRECEMHIRVVLLYSTCPWSTGLVY
jgi:hypothetical protein